MDLYYKIPKESETGKKFTSVFLRVDEVQETVNKVLDKYGFQEYRSHSIAGDIWCFCTPVAELDMKMWRKREDGYTPRKSTKAGRALAEEIEKNPSVSRKALNSCIGFDNGFSQIGFNRNKKGAYYGLILIDSWKIKVPGDCIEITGSEYKSIFQSGNI